MIWMEIRCDIMETEGCVNNFEYLNNHPMKPSNSKIQDALRSVRYLKKWAKTIGWKIKQDGEMICPSCQKGLDNG